MTLAPDRPPSLPLFAALALVAGLPVAAPAAASDEPVAMILAAPDRLAGLAFVEVHVGDRLALRPGEALEALDYRRCEEVRIDGGTVEAHPAGLRVEGGTSSVLLPDACADAFVAQASATAVDLSINLRGSASGDGRAMPAGEAVPVERVIVRFGSVVAEAYPSALVGWRGQAPVSAPTARPFEIALPAEVRASGGARLEVVLVAGDRPPRGLGIEIDVVDRRSTRVVHVR